MTDQDITHLQRMSRRFRLLFTAIMFAIPLLDLVYWLNFNSLDVGFYDGLPITPVQGLPPLFLVLGFLASLFPLTVAMIGMGTLAQLFRLYEQGIIFTQNNVRLFRRMGYVVIAWVLANMVFIPLISFVVSHGDPAIHPTVSVGITVSDLIAFAVGGIVLLISWVMNEGRKLEDDQMLTV